MSPKEIVSVVCECIQHFIDAHGHHGLDAAYDDGLLVHLWQHNGPGFYAVECFFVRAGTAGLTVETDDEKGEATRTFFPWSRIVSVGVRK